MSSVFADLGKLDPVVKGEMNLIKEIDSKELMHFVVVFKFGCLFQKMAFTLRNNLTTCFDFLNKNSVFFEVLLFSVSIGFFFGH